MMIYCIYWMKYDLKMCLIVFKKIHRYICVGFLTDDSYNFANSWVMNGAEEPCKRVAPPSQSCNSTGESVKVRHSHSYNQFCLIIQLGIFLSICVYAIGSDVTVWGHEQLRPLPALCAPHRSGTVRICVRVWCVPLLNGWRVCLPGHAGIRPHLCQSRSDPDQLARTKSVLWVTLFSHTYVYWSDTVRFISICMFVCGQLLSALLAWSTVTAPQSVLLLVRVWTFRKFARTNVSTAATAQVREESCDRCVYLISVLLTCMCLRQLARCWMEIAVLMSLSAPARTQVDATLLLPPSHKTATHGTLQNNYKQCI